MNLLFFLVFLRLTIASLSTGLMFWMTFANSSNDLKINTHEPFEMIKKGIEMIHYNHGQFKNMQFDKPASSMVISSE